MNKTETQHKWFSAVDVGFFLTMVIISLVGIVGNCLSCFVFSSAKLRVVSINLLLAALSATDLAVLILAVHVFSFSAVVHLLPSDVRNIYTHCFRFGYPITMTFQCASIWLHVVIGIERWLVVCRPFVVKKYCTRQSAILSVLVIFVLSIAFNTVRFWEYGLDENGQLVYGLHNEPQFLLWYVTVGNMVCMVVGPLIPLIISNLLIVRQLIKSSETRRTISASTDQIDNRTTTKMLLYILTVFIVCRSLALVLSVFEILGLQLYFDHTGNILSDLNNTLSITSAATTWIIYLKFCTAYREKAATLCCKHSESSNSSDSL